MSNNFTYLAKKKGLTRSRLLNECIKNFDTISVNSLKRKENKHSMTSYNCRLQDQNLKKLVDISAQLRLSKSCLLRLIINREIAKHEPSLVPSQKNESISILWYKGDLNKIVNDFENLDPDYCRFKDWMIAIQANIELGNFLGAKSILSKIYANFPSEMRNKKNVLKLNLLQFEIELYDRNFDNLFPRIPYLERQSIVEEDLELRCLYKYNLGTTYIVREEVDKALIALEEALQLSSFVDDTDKIKILLRLGRYYTYKFQYSHAQNCLDSACNLIKKLGNLHFYGWYLNEQGMKEFINKKYERAKNIFKNALDINLQTNSKRELFYSNRNLAKVSIINGKVDNAKSLLSQAKKYNFGNHDRLTLFEIYTSEDERKEKYEDVMKRMESRASEDYPFFSEYMINANRYLLGKDKVEKKEGKSGLERIATFGSYELIRTAAQKTLDEKKLQPVGHR